MQKTYLTTGELAKICNINKKTLFYYAEQGIFQPDIIGDNGYHYYSYEQLYIFYVIRALRDIGLSIKEIKDYIDHRDLEKLNKFLNLHQKHLQEEIRHKQRLSLLIKNKLQLFKDTCKITLNKISLQQLPSSKLLLSENLRNERDIAVQHHIVQRHINYCLQNKLNVGYQLGGMVAKEDILCNNTENYSYCFTKTTLSIKRNAPACAQPFIQPAGLYAVGYFQGTFPNYNGAYTKILDFLQKNQCIIDDFSYEEPLIDEISTSNENNYVTRIAIKIKET